MTGIFIRWKSKLVVVQFPLIYYSFFLKCTVRSGYKIYITVSAVKRYYPDLEKSDKKIVGRAHFRNFEDSAKTLMVKLRRCRN